MDIERDILEEIVRFEDKLRCSEKWQAKFQERDTNEWRTQICNQLQTEAVLTELPELTPEQLHAALITLRNHRSVYRFDDDFYKPVYVRYDRSTYMDWAHAAHDGAPVEAPPLADVLEPSQYTGDEIPCPTDLLLHQLDGTPTTLLEVLTGMEGIAPVLRDWDSPTLQAEWTPKPGLEPGTEAYLWGQSKPCVLLAGSLT